ncbi:MAG: hypothetical protein DSY80_07425, partial [Desulfocapsa sp.]
KAILSPRAGVTIRINPGDWIVKEESGLVAHTAEVFERVYEEKECGCDLIVNQDNPDEEAEDDHK